MDYYCDECKLKVVVYKENDEVKMIKACLCESPIIASITMDIKKSVRTAVNV